MSYCDEIFIYDNSGITPELIFQLKYNRSLRIKMQSNDITFYQRFEADILAGRKTITIRDKSESHFKAGDILRVGRFEDNQYFCTIEVLSVSPITLNELTEQHAKQENMGLNELKEVIRGIYPNEIIFWVIQFSLKEYFNEEKCVREIIITDRKFN